MSDMNCNVVVLLCYLGYDVFVKCDMLLWNDVMWCVIDVCLCVVVYVLCYLDVE